MLLRNGIKRLIKLFISKKKIVANIVELQPNEDQKGSAALITG